MKKLLLFFGIFLLTINFIYAQEDTIYSVAYTATAYRNFDYNDRGTGNYFFIDTTQLNNIWEIGAPGKILFNSAYSSPLALVTDTMNAYPINNTSSFTFTIATDDATTISFWHQINSDSLSDGGVVEFSTDGGVTWNNILNSSYTLTNFYSNSSSIASNSNKSGFTGTSSWVQSTIQGYALDFVKFKFTFTSDNSNTSKDGWMIDDFFVNCIGTGIDEIRTASHFHFFPNPTTNIISILSDNSTQLKTVALKNNLGQTILETDNAVIDLSLLVSGIYFYELTDTKGLITTGKFIKK